VNSNTGYANGETSEMYNKFWYIYNSQVEAGNVKEGESVGTEGADERHVTVTFNVRGYEGVVWIYLALDVFGCLL